MACPGGVRSRETERGMAVRGLTWSLVSLEFLERCLVLASTAGGLFTHGAAGDDIPHLRVLEVN